MLPLVFTERRERVCRYRCSPSGSLANEWYLRFKCDLTTIFAFYYSSSNVEVIPIVTAISNLVFEISPTIDLPTEREAMGTNNRLHLGKKV